MNMQQMLQSVKKMQREYEKEHKKLEETTFKGSANGIVEVALKGDFTLEKVTIFNITAIKTSDNINVIFSFILINIILKKRKLSKLLHFFYVGIHFLLPQVIHFLFFF